MTEDIRAIFLLLRYVQVELKGILITNHGRFTFEYVSRLTGYRLCFLLLEEHGLNNLPRILLPLLKHSTCHLRGHLCVDCVRLSQQNLLVLLLFFIKHTDTLIIVGPFLLNCIVEVKREDAFGRRHSILILNLSVVSGLFSVAVGVVGRGRHFGEVWLKLDHVDIHYLITVRYRRFVNFTNFLLVVRFHFLIGN